MSQAPVLVRVFTVKLDAKTLAVAGTPCVSDLDEARIGRLAEGFCPWSDLASAKHHGDQKLLVAPNGWAYCPFRVETDPFVSAWRLEGFEGSEEGSGG